MNKKICCIGGGTGTYQVLTGLKKYPVDLTAVVSMTDSGGSNRVLRDEFGLLPTSDIRQCLVALASPGSDELLRKLFIYRYDRGTGISGMTFGNLFMAALADIYNSQEKAIDKTCEILNIQGKIFPVTYDNVHLVARYENGRQVLGEHHIDQPDKKLGKYGIVGLEVVPRARANKKALVAIKQADLLVIGPGDLYTSIICNLVVEGVSQAIKKSQAKKIFIINLMTKFGQTNNFTAKDHLRELEKYLGKGVVDVCLINKTRPFSNKILARYTEEQAVLVIDDLDSQQKLKVIRGDFVDREIYQRQPRDKIKRSLIRHDPDKLAKAIISLL